MNYNFVLFIQLCLKIKESKEKTVSKSTYNMFQDNKKKLIHKCWNCYLIILYCPLVAFLNTIIENGMSDLSMFYWLTSIFKDNCKPNNGLEAWDVKLLKLY